MSLQWLLRGASDLLHLSGEVGSPTVDRHSSLEPKIRAALPVGAALAVPAGAPQPSSPSGATVTAANPGSAPPPAAPTPAEFAMHMRDLAEVLVWSDNRNLDDCFA
nr:hypothetical protein HK105_005294 [Polyrhizophydium stewartii]